MEAHILARRRWLQATASLWLLVAIGAVLAGAARADGRCNGSPGYQVWQDTNRSGPSALTCGVSSTTWRPDYTQWRDNLQFFWETWNDRVSSLETFNFTGHRVDFFRDVNYVYRLLIVTDNEIVNDLRPWNSNDQFSSSRTPY